MKKLCAILMTVIFVFLNSVSFAADIPVNMVINGDRVSFARKPFMRDGITFADVQDISSKLSLSCKTFEGHNSIMISNSGTAMCIIPGEEYATVADLNGSSDSEFSFKKLSAPAVYVGKTLFVAVRDIATEFGYPLFYKSDTQTVYLGYSPEILSPETLQKAQSLTYYFQNQTEFNLPSYGSGYCWTCSYAMLISNATGQRITPNDVAAVNISKGSGGEYCYHGEIANNFGVYFTSALSVTSPYYGGRDSKTGGTLIENPTKNDNVVRAALREALANHPEGVMVRYADYPHTMVAVAREGDVILFNDPAPSGSGTYSDDGKYHIVPFSQTCIAAKGFRLSDISFIQAINVY